jgi:hypothetical protein
MFTPWPGRALRILAPMSAVHFVSGPGSTAAGDVVFVHGLDGDPFTTWEVSPGECWLKWIDADRKDLNVWSLEYELKSSAWRGHALPLTDRATNVLAALDAVGIGRRPLCFITHSMGGLLVKQLLRHALDFAREYEPLARRTRGIVFFSTPHAGSDTASLVSYLRFFFRPTPAIADLEAHAPALRELNLWYRNSVADLDIASKVFWETFATNGMTVVNATSADPGIPGVTPIPVDADHVEICKPATRHDLQYLQTLKFLAERLPQRTDRGMPGYFSAQQQLTEDSGRPFVGRLRVQQLFETFLTRHDRGYFVVEGDPGQGKTALAGQVVRKRACTHHFVSREGGRNDSSLILRSLLSQLHPNGRAVPGPSETLSELAKRFDDQLRTVVNSSSDATVIVIDGLDELRSPNNLDLPPFLLFDSLPRRLFFFVTSRPGAPLDAIRDRLALIPQATHKLEPLAGDEVKALIEEYGVKLTDEEIVSLTGISAGNALYVEAVAHALHDGAAFDPDTLPRSVEGYFRHAVRDLPASPVRHDVLGFLAASRAALSVGQLASLTAASERQLTEAGLAPIRQFLKSTDGRFDFYHASFHTFVTREVLYADELRKYHGRLSQWLSEPANVNSEQRLLSLAYHLAEAEEHQELRERINASFLTQKGRRFGYAVLEDLDLLARSLLSSGEVSAIDTCVQLVDALRPVMGPGLLAEVTKGATIDARIPVSGMDAHALMIPKGTVTADFIEVVPMGDRTVLAIGDAPASGLESAFVARFIGALFRRLVETSQPLDLSRVLKDLNGAIAAHPHFNRVSMQAIELRPSEGRIAICNAGHPYPVLYSARRGRCDRLAVHGRLLRDLESDVPSPEYEVRHAETGPGDILVMVSDGLTEDGRLDGGAYGYRFAALIEEQAHRTARAICQSILQDWRAHPRDPAYIDDLSALVLVTPRVGEHAH